MPGDKEKLSGRGARPLTSPAVRYTAHFCRDLDIDIAPLYLTFAYTIPDGTTISFPL